MNEEIIDVKPPMGFSHIKDLAGSEATILQVANSQGDILGYATLDDIDAYIEQKVSETVHSFSQKQTFQDVTINGTFEGNNVVNQSKLNDALMNLDKLSITSIANITSLVSIIENMESGKRVQYWIENPSIINDIPIPSIGIIETYKNNVGNRAEQIFRCTIPNTDRIYYRYVEWNGINWGSPFGWKEITTSSDLANYVENAINLGTDGGTEEKNLSGGVYLYLTNLHPHTPQKGIYVITVGSQPVFNTVTTYIADPSITNISISTTENKLTVTTNSAFRGAFIKLCDYIV